MNNTTPPLDVPTDAQAQMLRNIASGPKLITPSSPHAKTLVYFGWAKWNQPLGIRRLLITPAGEEALAKHTAGNRRP